jgi:hypothetical protein
MLLGKVVICLQKTETKSMPVTCTNINSKWIKDLNIRPETLQLVHKRAGNPLEAIGTGKDFLSRTPISPATKRKDRQMGLHEIKKLCTTKEMVFKLKKLPTE